MRKILLYLLSLILIIQLVNAAEVCVVAHYRDGEADSKCIDIDEGKNGYDLLEEIGWNLLWSPESAFGHMLCKINDVGTDVSGQYCAYSGEYWNIILNRNNKWLHLPVGLDAPGNCWNYDINSWDGHYCTKNGDVLGFAFGKAGAEPEMFIVNISKVYVDGEKETKAKDGGGKIRDVFPGSEVKFKIELENLYDTSTDIDIEEISIEATIEEIDDGDDIEEEIKEFDLKADRKITKTLTFNIPLEVDAKDRLLRIELKADDTAGIKYKKEFTYDLEVEKENHKLKILKTELDKEAYKCGETALLDFSILNIGTKDEKVNLQITNDDLSLNINENFELEEGAFESSNKYENKFNLWLPDNLSKTTYPITITANYGAEKEIENINLVVDECEIKEIITKKEVTTVEKDQPATKEKQTEPEKEPTEETGTTILEEMTSNNLMLALILIFGVLVVIIVAALAYIFFIKK